RSEASHRGGARQDLRRRYGLMTESPSNPVLRHLRSLVGTSPDDGTSDGQLLERFATHGEEEAFEALVRRHGRVVLGVCRRILGHEQDAEDAYQVTFLLLARNAPSIRKRASVSSWLYGVACRVATTARGRAARRLARERRAAVSGCGPDDDVLLRELQ